MTRSPAISFAAGAVPWLRRVLLVLALLFGQLGGVVHGAGHHHDPDKERPHVCQLCAAYSAFEHAPPTTGFALPGASPRIVAVSPPRHGRAAATRPPYLGRAPPVCLA